MIKVIEKYGKTVDEAISKALLELNLTKDDVEIEVIEEGSKGFLGMGSKDAHIIVKEIVNFPRIATNFLDIITTGMGLNAKCVVDEFKTSINIVLEGEDMGILIGRRGETLDAIQYLTSLAVNKYSDSYIKINLDSENYRAKREYTLTHLAKRLAGQVIRTRTSVTLEPMSANERRIIHSTLQGHSAVSTYSTGDEPHRKVVIALK